MRGFYFNREQIYETGGVKMLLSHLVYYAATAVVSAVLGFNSITPKDWSFWIVLACLIISYIAGTESEG